MQTKQVKYADAIRMIDEADVLMFRGGDFPSVGWWVARYGGGIYSHVALASWNDDLMECVEFREWKGGRTVSLFNQVLSNPGTIDVYRLSPVVETPVLYRGNGAYNGESKVRNVRIELTPEIKRKITTTARELTGNEYGWSIIWRLVKHYLPGLRLLAPKTKDDDPTKVFVCSTLVSYAVRTNYADIVPNQNDQYTVPSDLARSPLLNYLFTIVP
jgi:hypothetical protein